MSLFLKALSDNIVVTLLISLLVLSGYSLYAWNHTNTLETKISIAQLQLKVVQDNNTDLSSKLKSQTDSINKLSEMSDQKIKEQKAALEQANKDSEKYQRQILSLSEYKFTKDVCKDVHNLLSDFGE